MKLNKEVVIAAVIGSVIGIMVGIVLQEIGVTDGFRKVVRNEL
jgi:ABC-type phosphate transport system permease subunit